MHAAGLQRIEMRHQRDIVAVIPADAREVEREGIGIEEVVLEDGKSAAERLTPDIDDLRVGQSGQNHAEITEIVRHLVGEEGPVPFAVGAGTRDVIAACVPRLLRR